MFWLVVNVVLGLAKIVREAIAMLATLVLLSGCAHWLTEEGWHGSNYIYESKAHCLHK